MGTQPAQPATRVLLSSNPSICAKLIVQKSRHFLSYAYTHVSKDTCGDFRLWLPHDKDNSYNPSIAHTLLLSEFTKSIMAQLVIPLNHFSAGRPHEFASISAQTDLILSFLILACSRFRAVRSNLSSFFSLGIYEHDSF